MPHFSTLRLTLLRAAYLLLVVGLSIKWGPVVFGDIATLPPMEGVVAALLGTVGLLSVAGLVSPVRMLPILVFEVAWKLVWLAAVALPRAIGGGLDGATVTTLWAFAWVLPIVFVVPWGYVARTYLASAEPVRAGAQRAPSEARA